jgi:molybdopterin-guanine dinucleotide biosynthesis protein B
MSVTPVPIVCFVGRSNSGKTTLIERLIPELVIAGYRVATVKHAGHGFNLDTEGKDSWRHKRAGASSVIVVSKGSLAMFADVNDEVHIEEIRERFVDPSLDLIIAEGWKNDGYPKIVVVRDQLGEVPVSEEGLLALVSNKPLSARVPVYDPDDIKGISELLMARFPKRTDRPHAG